MKQCGLVRGMIMTTGEDENELDKYDWSEILSAWSEKLYRKSKHCAWCISLRGERVLITW